MRNNRAAMTFLMAAVLAAAWPHGVADAQSRPPVRDDVGARFVPAGAIKQTRPYYAVLLISEEGAAQSIRVCNEYKNKFNHSLINVADNYRYYVFFSKDKAYSLSTIDCSKLGQAYDSSVYSDHEEKLNLRYKGDGGPFLVVVFPKADGTLINAGYVNFQDSNKVGLKFDRFNAYFKKGPCSWREDLEIDVPESFITTSWNLVTFRWIWDRDTTVRDLYNCR